MAKSHSAAGKLGGSVKSARKAAAVRENGKKGGRPKKLGVSIRFVQQYDVAADHIPTKGEMDAVRAARSQRMETIELSPLSPFTGPLDQPYAKSSRGFWTRYTQKDK